MYTEHKDNVDFRDVILEQNRQTPRYTSYPTAPHFISDPLRAEEFRSDCLSNVGRGSDVSVYVHIPFCQKVCWYCGCNTNITRRYDPISDYVDILLKEISAKSKLMKGKPLAHHVHFGGGSPGILSAEDFQRIMDALRESYHFYGETEIALEVDPRIIDENQVRGYARNGVNRVSLGVQDFNEQTMEAVNRVQPYELVADVFGMLRRHGIAQINVDLMYGLPHQDLKTMEQTINMLVPLKPDRVALFGYAHVPWMKKHMEQIRQGDLPNSDSRYDMFEKASEMFIDAGFRAIGIDHFAQGEDELSKVYDLREMKRNFQGYTTDSAPSLIGYGASAISQYGAGFVQNAVSVPAYKKTDHKAQKFMVLTDEDRVAGQVIQNLMCYMQSEVPDEIGAYDREQLNEYEKIGFVSWQGSVLHIHEKARQAVRLICACFDLHLQRRPSDVPQHSKVI